MELIIKVLYYLIHPNKNSDKDHMIDVEINSKNLKRCPICGNISGSLLVVPHNLSCKYCNKHFNHYNNKWRHEKNCKQKDQIIVIDKNEYENIKKQLETNNKLLFTFE